MIRQVARAAAAMAAAATLIGGLAMADPPVIRAAEPGLRIVTQARYTALPAERRIHVTVDARATNDTPDPPDGRYYYTDARFALQPAIRNLAAAASGTAVAARIVESAREFTTVEIALGRTLFHGQSTSLRFSYDIVDPGGTPQRDVRVAPSLVAFPVWAFGSEATAGSTVSVVIPAGYTITVEAGQLTSSRASNGTTTLSAVTIPDPYTFFAYLTAERPGAFTDVNTPVTLPEGPVTVRVRAWDDDPDWGTRTRNVIEEGLPALRDLIGLPFQVRGTLTVEEAASSRLGDYAGVYNDVTELIDVRYDADGYTTLHEAAHTWFNATLFADRWIGEAWAEYYGVEAGRRIGADGQIFTLTPTLRAAKIPLNAWGAIGAEPAATEDYAYAATYRLAQLVAGQATSAGLQRVWQAALGGESSYQPAHPGEAPEKGTAATVDGWQRLLDLLDERTRGSYDDLWRDWVVTDAQRASLDERSRARTAYAKTVTAAGDWELPYQVRYTIGAWQFDKVESLLAGANAVLADRDEIARRAASLDLSVPNTVRAAFESGTTFDVAQQDAESELVALDALSGAERALARQPDATERVGLLLADPSAQLAAARDRFQQGDADSATRDAQAAVETRTSAADVGRLRIGVAGGGILALDGLAMSVLALRRRRRRLAWESARSASAAATVRPDPENEPIEAPEPDPERQADRERFA